MTQQDPPTPDDALPARPYTSVRVHDGVAYTAGHVPFDRSSGKVLGSSVEEQTAAVLRLIDSTLRTNVGVGIDAVLAFNVYLTDISTIDEVDRAFRAALTQPYPARTTVGISALGRPQFLVEISATAAVHPA